MRTTSISILIASALLLGCASTNDEPQGATRTELQTNKPICDAFAGVCADRKHVETHGCGGSAVAVDENDWCTSRDQICCVIFAP